MFSIYSSCFYIYSYLCFYIYSYLCFYIYSSSIIDTILHDAYFIIDSSIDLMFFSLHIVGLSSLLGSINFIVTLLKSSNLSIINSFLFLPLYCWSIFFTSVLLIISLPVLAGVITMIIFDRHFNCSFFDPLRGGDLLLLNRLSYILWLVIFPLALIHISIP